MTVSITSSTRWLTPAEIKDRIDRFNASRPYGWSIFDDVPEHQQINVLYPFTMVDLTHLAFERIPS